MPPIIARGFRGRREGAPPGRVPPGQYVTMDFPVLSAGPTPHTPLERWDFTISGEVDQPRRWTWDEFRALPAEEITADIHCVTKWSKLDTVWQGVRVDTLLEGIETSAGYTVDEAAKKLKEADCYLFSPCFRSCGHILKDTLTPERAALHQDSRIKSFQDFCGLFPDCDFCDDC